MSVLLYWLAVRAYGFAIRIASVFNRKAQLFVSGRKNLLEHIRYALMNERRPRIWMHCASLGEFEQGRPVLEQLRATYPGHALVLTFFSPSGYEVRKNYPGADYIFYLPTDSPRSAARFISFVQPKLAIFVKYEYWYFLLRQLEVKHIPAILISAIFRKEQPFFRWYGGLHRKMLNCFSRIFVQDEASRQLLQTIGVNDAQVAGDTRFDRVVAAVQQAIPLPVAEAFCAGGKVLIAGSSWPEDERFLRRAWEGMPPGWKLVIVPHEVHEAHIAAIEQLFGNETVRWSRWSDESEARVLIVDTIGVLLPLYRYGQLVWIGGGFGKGIHNTLEAAAYGLPLGFGPEYSKFREAKELIACGAAFSTSAPADLLNCISNWEKDTASYERAAHAAKHYVHSQAGATDMILNYLSEKNELIVS
ncbi:MAG: 3-deoxy-D-manno-octulosonic acid transferase [Flavipsychrobacter sp.]|nr:3-deoxy-D-manno-octulosonic acid transferase [Flavipsychrobacter sp.]